MTRKEAKHIVDIAFGVAKAVRRVGEERTYHEDEIREAKNIAMEALEQEPCEDCISREKAKQFLYERLDRLNDDELYDIFSRVIDDMYNELPSVTPQPKKGRWKGHFHGFPPEPTIVCSECGFDRDFYLRYEDCFDKIHYCPNCGAKMEVDE